MATRGDFDSGEFFHEWIRTNWTAEGWNIALEEGFEALVIDTLTGKCYMYENRLYPYEVKAPFAIGSGFKYAMGAMLAGATAAQAVEIAARLDKNTGGEVQVIDVLQKLSDLN